MRLKVRSVVGLLPLCAAAVFGPEQLAHLDGTLGRLRAPASAPDSRPSLHPLATGGMPAGTCCPLSTRTPRASSRSFSMKANPRAARGIRSLSLRMRAPLVSRSLDESRGLPAGGVGFRLFVGNSNGAARWDAGECILSAPSSPTTPTTETHIHGGGPDRSGRHMTLFELAHELARRYVDFYADYVRRRSSAARQIQTSALARLPMFTSISRDMVRSRCEPPYGWTAWWRPRCTLRLNPSAECSSARTRGSSARRRCDE